MLDPEAIQASKEQLEDQEGVEEKESDSQADPDLVDTEEGGADRAGEVNRDPSVSQADRESPDEEATREDEHIMMANPASKDLAALPVSMRSTVRAPERTDRALRASDPNDPRRTMDTTSDLRTPPRDRMSSPCDNTISNRDTSSLRGLQAQLRLLMTNRCDSSSSRAMSSRCRCMIKESTRHQRSDHRETMQNQESHFKYWPIQDTRVVRLMALWKIEGKKRGDTNSRGRIRSRLGNQPGTGTTRPDRTMNRLPTPPTRNPRGIGTRNRNRTLCKLKLRLMKNRDPRRDPTNSPSLPNHPTRSPLRRPRRHTINLLPLRNLMRNRTRRPRLHMSSPRNQRSAPTSNRYLSRDHTSSQLRLRQSDRT
ncbi:hypothetical protein PMAYCL1PPCAC_09705 [Pristionchus mayeri]|uniref:Uncharacterized protein n=1 Tax=Pristionchus mayeri TaxID=1317129 RepID=A0AAN4ZM38_9BILA|nr:hypothetical protein PMAYCL1PPCAC_09705 [Pristionchus mayeri]